MEESFRVEDGMLVRAAVPARGVPYEHRCSLADFEAVAHTIDEANGALIALMPLAEQVGLPSTRVNVALSFLKERGCVVPASRRMHKAATKCVHLDAMIEYHALREKGPAA